jgi:hypothetical protein
MVRTVVLKALNENDETGNPLECVTDDQVELFLNLENYEELEKVLHRLFDAQSVERIKAAAQEMKKR